MEPIGLTLGIVALASLFDTCISLADTIRLASNLGRDYEIAYTKFLLLKSRFGAWGASLKAFEDPSAVDPAIRERWIGERVLIGRTLTAIKTLLSDAQSLESKYGLSHRTDSGSLDSEDKVSVENDSIRKLQDSRSGTLEEIEMGLEATIKHRQRTTSWNRKLSWAISDKKKFSTLIDDLAFHVSELENLALRLNTPASRALPESIAKIRSRAALELLEAAASEPELGAVAGGGQKETAGHLYMRTLVSERGMVIQGDQVVGGVPVAGKSHRYAFTEVTGTGRVMMGNVSGEFMEKFFGL